MDEINNNEQQNQNSLVLRTEGLVKRYGKRTVANGVSINVKQGEIVGLLGPNGAGKTTSFYMTTGLVVPNEGHVFLGDQEITDFPVYKRARAGIGYLPQEASVFRKMSVEDNILSVLEMTGKPRSYQLQKLESLINEFRLNKVPGQLSGGMRQRCALIRTLATEPEILLLDEPFSALDYQTRLAVSADIWRILQQEGKTALLVTHDIAEAVSMSDRVVVLSRRPAVVKVEMDMGALRGLPPLERRDTPEFHRYFNAIWKELDVHA